MYDRLERRIVDSRIPFEPTYLCSKKGLQVWGPAQPMKWTQDIAIEIVKFFRTINFPYRQVGEIPFKEPLRSNIRRFLVSLDAYLMSPNPVLSDKFILIGATHVDFAKRLKRIKRKSIIETWGANSFETPSWWNDVPGYQICDIGDIFNYNYLLHWEVPTDDYKYGFIPVSIDDKMEERYKNALRAILPDKAFRIIDPNEILVEIKSSACFEKGNSSKHFLEKPRHLQFSKLRGTAKRSVIQVSPENVRDTVICQVEDLNTISLIDKQVLEVLSQMSGHIHLRSETRIDKLCRRLWKKQLYFVHRDLQKEGITKPRELLTWALEVLHELYPEVPAFEYIHFYTRYSIMVDGQILHPDRGHGLGMANSLTTLMQLAVDYLIREKLASHGMPFDYQTLILNDDFVAGFPDLEAAENYWDYEDSIMRKLSLIREPSKSFVSRDRFVIAERYHDLDYVYDKTSYQIREALYALTCQNITHAKEYFISCQQYVKPHICMKFVKEVQSYWGYEFFPTESLYPYHVGGWINESINGVSLSLTRLEKMPHKSYLGRGAQAVKSRLRKRSDGKIYRSPAHKLYKPETVEGYEEIFDYLPLGRIHEKYGRIGNDPKFWDRLYKKRQKVFKHSESFDEYELVKYIIENNLTTQFYPRDFMIDRYEMAEDFVVDIEDYYLDPDPLRALRNYINKLPNALFKESFSVLFTKRDSFNTAGLLSRNSRLEDMFHFSENSLGDEDCLLPRDLDIKIEESYLNPIAVGVAAAKLDWGRGFPIMKSIWRHPLIERKREVFGRILSPREIMRITELEIPRNVLKRIINHCGDQDLLPYIEDFFDFYRQEVFSNYRPPPEPEKEVEDDNIITRAKILRPGLGLYFNYRLDRDNYRVDNEETTCLIEKIGQVILTLTYPGYMTDEERLSTVEYMIETDPDIQLAVALGNLMNLITPEPLDDEEAYDWGLFDNNSD